MIILINLLKIIKYNWENIIKLSLTKGKFKGWNSLAKMLSEIIKQNSKSMWPITTLMELPKHCYP
jgi:hypothetical protein